MYEAAASPRREEGLSEALSVAKRNAPSDVLGWLHEYQKKCAASEMGQHIFLIWSNARLLLLRECEIEADGAEDGGENGANEDAEFGFVKVDLTELARSGV